MPKHPDTSKDFLCQLGENIRNKRKKKGLTLEQLGLEIGLTRMQVNRIENGYNITMNTLLKITIALNLKPKDLAIFEYSNKKEVLEGLVNSSKSYKKPTKKSAKK